MSPFVSVIIPVYNSHDYLGQALESVINQSLSNIEIILIDDGSTDESIKVINGFLNADCRVLLVKQDHKGAAAARNKGLELATGEYLSFLDSDDVFDSAMLESMYTVSVENNLDVLLTPYRFSIDDPRAKRGLVMPKMCPAIFSCYSCPEDFFQIVSPNAWSKLFRREFILMNNLKFQEITTCNDVFFSYAAMLLADRISILNESFVAYRRDVLGSISSKRGDGYDNILRAGSALRELLCRAGKYDLLKKTFYKRIFSCIEYEARFVSDENFELFNRLVALFLIEEFKA